LLALLATDLVDRPDVIRVGMQPTVGKQVIEFGTGDRGALGGLTISWPSAVTSSRPKSDWTCCGRLPK